MGDVYTHDKIVLKEGFCFGEFGLLNGQTRGQTIISLDETVLLGLKEEHFKRYLQSFMMKTEGKRKAIIFDLIPYFKMISFKKFQAVYRNFIFNKVYRHNYIFKENELADSIVIVFSGRCKLIKGKKDLIYVGKNDIVGLESIENASGTKHASFYKSSLYTVDDCFIIKIRVNLLGPLTKGVVASLQQLKAAKEAIIGALVENKAEKKYKLVNKKAVIKNLTNGKAEHKRSLTQTNVVYNQRSHLSSLSPNKNRLKLPQSIFLKQSELPQAGGEPKRVLTCRGVPKGMNYNEDYYQFSPVEIGSKPAGSLTTVRKETKSKTFTDHLRELEEKKKLFGADKNEFPELKMQKFKKNMTPVNNDIISTAKVWRRRKSTEHKLKTFYDSGGFDMPLMVNLLTN